MVDKSLEEIKSYFEKAKEEYKKQLFSFEDDLNYYKEFLQLIGKTEDDALLEVKNCKDYLKCRKILVNSFFKYLQRGVEVVYESEYIALLKEVKSILRDFKLDSLVNIDELSKKELETAVFKLKYFYKIKNFYLKLIEKERLLKKAKEKKVFFDVIVPKIKSKSENIVSYSNNIEYMLLKNYSLLSDEDLELLFLIKYFEHNLETFNIFELLKSSKEIIKKRVKRDIPLVVNINVVKLSQLQEFIIKALILYIFRKVKEVYVVYNDNLIYFKEKISLKSLIEFFSALLGEYNNIDISLKLSKEKNAKLLIISERFLPSFYENSYLLVISEDFVELENKHKNEKVYNIKDDEILLLKALFELI